MALNNSRSKIASKLKKSGVSVTKRVEMSATDLKSSMVQQNDYADAEN